MTSPLHDVKDWTVGQLAAVVSALGGSTNVEIILKNVDLRKQIVALIVGAKSADEKLYPVVVDYSQSLAEMIEAGLYDWSHEDIIARHFPFIYTGQVEHVALQLIHFDGHSSSHAVLTNLERRGLRPATLPELLAFGTQYPELQRQFPIVSLGSVWVHLSHSFVAVLSGCDDGTRRLQLAKRHYPWTEQCRFLAVPK